MCVLERGPSTPVQGLHTVIHTRQRLPLWPETPQNPIPNPSVAEVSLLGWVPPAPTVVLGSPQLGPLKVYPLSLLLPNMTLLAAKSSPWSPVLARLRPLHLPLPQLWEEEDQEGRGRRGLTQNNSGQKVNLATERGGERPYWLGGGEGGPERGVRGLLRQPRRGVQP